MVSHNRGIKIDYARVSIDDQNPDLQIQALKKARCKSIHTDKVWGMAGAQAQADRATRRPCPPASGQWRKSFQYCAAAGYWALNALPGVETLIHDGDAVIHRRHTTPACGDRGPD